MTIDYSQMTIVFCSLKTSPDYKINIDQTWSCPRDYRLSTSWGPIEGAPWNYPNHHSTIALGGFKEGFQLFTIMPRDASLSDSRCNLFQSGSFLLEEKIKYLCPNFCNNNTIPHHKTSMYIYWRSKHFFYQYKNTEEV